jgi:hypothetical protein
LKNSVNRAELLVGDNQKRKMNLFKSDKVGPFKTRKSSTNEWLARNFTTSVVALPDKFLL